MTQPAPFFRCWADATRDQELPYERTAAPCSTDNDIYIDEDQSSGEVSVSHQLLSTRMLNAPRFFALSPRCMAATTPLPGTKPRHELEVRDTQRAARSDDDARVHLHAPLSQARRAL